jgi:hypothetical protein
MWDVCDPDSPACPLKVRLISEANYSHSFGQSPEINVPLRLVQRFPLPGPTQTNALL